MKLTRYEQESILNYNAGEQTATLYTRSRFMSKDSKTGQRTHRQPKPTKIIVERHYNRH